MMNNSAALELFINTYFGMDIPPELRALIADACVVRQLEKRGILFHEGEPGNNMFFLAKGLIKLYRINEDGKEAIIHLVHDGQIFAEIVLKPDTPYPVSAEALEDCTVVSLSVKKLFDLIHADRGFMQRFIALLTFRLKTFVDKVQSLTSQDVEGRLLSYLQSLSDDKHTKTVRIPVAKKDLALLLGSTPETLSRVFARLTADGIIVVDGQHITIL